MRSSGGSSSRSNCPRGELDEVVGVRVVADEPGEQRVERLALRASLRERDDSAAAKRFLSDDGAARPLRLVDSQVTTTGAILATYDGRELTDVNAMPPCARPTRRLCLLGHRLPCAVD